MRHKAGNGHHVNFEKLLEDLKVVVQDSEDLLKAGSTRVKEKAVAGAESTDKYIRENPYQSLGIAFGIGLIAGLFVLGLRGRSEED
jgi:ElaB/YqjD/DUF883 family membrane-anchored ribosome-binding protein